MRACDGRRLDLIRPQCVQLARGSVGELDLSALVERNDDLERVNTDIAQTEALKLRPHVIPRHLFTTVPDSARVFGDEPAEMALHVLLGDLVHHRHDRFIHAAALNIRCGRRIQVESEQPNGNLFGIEDGDREQLEHSEDDQEPLADSSKNAPDGRRGFAGCAGTVAGRGGRTVRGLRFVGHCYLRMLREELPRAARIALKIGCAVSLRAWIRPASDALRGRMGSAGSRAQNVEPLRNNTGSSG